MRSRRCSKLLLTEQERSGWPRTKKAGRLSARRADLASAADAYPLLQILIEIGIIDKQINTFGAGLAAQVSPVTGRIHASYRVASTKSGRASCNHPNLQKIPDQQRISDMVSFRTLFRAQARLRLCRRRLVRDGDACGRCDRG